MSSGIWAVLNADYNGIDRAYSEDDEIGARRSVGEQGYYSQVLYVPFGIDILDALKNKYQPPVKAESDSKPVFETVDNRDPECVERWPDCESFKYDDKCCRFPKNCSAGNIWTQLVEPEESSTT